MESHAHIRMYTIHVRIESKLRRKTKASFNTARGVAVLKFTVPRHMLYIMCIFDVEYYAYQY